MSWPLLSASLALICVMSPQAYADQESLGTMLKGGWRVLSIAKHRTEMVCPFMDGKCEENHLEAADLVYLTKEDGLGFCVGSLWWQGDAKQWVCVKTNEASIK